MYHANRTIHLMVRDFRILMKNVPLRYRIRVPDEDNWDYFGVMTHKRSARPVRYTTDDRYETPALRGNFRDNGIAEQTRHFSLDNGRWPDDDREYLAINRPSNVDINQDIIYNGDSENDDLDNYENFDQDDSEFDNDKYTQPGQSISSNAIKSVTLKP